MLTTIKTETDNNFYNHRNTKIIYKFYYMTNRYSYKKHQHDRAGSRFVPLLHEFMPASNVNVSSLHVVNAYGGSRGLAPGARGGVVD
jgi:hypothetical protein